MFLLLWLTIPVDAQRQKAMLPKQTPQEQEHQAKIERMVMSTERVMFVDSFVVDKEDMLRAFLLSHEAGSIRKTADMLKNYRPSDSYGYLNSMGNRRFFSMHETDSTSLLFSSDYDEGQWTAPEQMLSINAELQYTNVNYPFMMGDGQTLYFAAEGEGSIGGYDIFMTTYDREIGRYLHPINIGMPFNSEANDYLYAIDEYNNLGWFATDRRQPKGKVCIYVFLPNKVRKTYDADSYTPEQLHSFAAISSIRQTWSSSRTAQAARNRIYQIQNSPKQAAGAMAFAITDDLIYHRAADFCCPENANRYQLLLDLRSYMQQLSQSLEKSRNYYTRATADERSQLTEEILSEERQQELLCQRIGELEKTIRNSEIIFLTNK